MPVGLHAFHGNRIAVKGLILGICLGAWALSGAGYFWPVWPALGLVIAEVVHQLLCIGARSQEPRLTELRETRAEVDELVAKAVAAGGSAPRAPQDHGFMYAHGFEDPDGHIWELIHMPPAREGGGYGWPHGA